MTIMGSELLYRDGIGYRDLHVDECCIYRHGDSARQWILAFRFVRKTDGHHETRAIPVNPGGDAGGGPDPRSWGLRQGYHADRWQVSPSIACFDVDSDGGRVEVWHETPELVGVPHTAAWVVELKEKAGAR